MADANDRLARRDEAKGGIGETIKVIVQAVLIALVFRTFLFHPFNIPSGSMIPTLLEGDYLFVSKYSYGYSRYSFPLGSLLPFEGRFFADEPERGDVAVFRLPRDPDVDYIKRVIGLPGDDVQVRDGLLYINGALVEHEPMGAFEGPIGRFGDTRKVPLFQETLPNGVEYDVLDMIPDSLKDNTEVYRVPEGHYFMMGDNRDNSTDSRFLTDVGFVPFENFIGRAEFIFFSVDADARAWEFWRWPWTLRPSRIFNGL